MVSPSDKAALRDASIEEMEFDAAETKELDKLPRELASAAYLGRSQVRIGLVSDFLLPQAIIYDLIDIRFPLRIQ